MSHIFVVAGALICPEKVNLRFPLHCFLITFFRFVCIIGNILDSHQQSIYCFLACRSIPPSVAVYLPQREDLFSRAPE